MMKIYFAVHDVAIYGMQWVEKLVKECKHEIQLLLFFTITFMNRMSEKILLRNITYTRNLCVHTCGYIKAIEKKMKNI